MNLIAFILLAMLQARTPVDPQPVCVRLGQTILGWTAADIYRPWSGGPTRVTWIKGCRDCPEVEFDTSLLTIPTCVQDPYVKGIFRDGFESGDFCGWTTCVQLGTRFCLCEVAQE